jgi:hypothetical protein
VRLAVIISLVLTTSIKAQSLIEFESVAATALGGATCAARFVEGYSRNPASGIGDSSTLATTGAEFSPYVAGVPGAMMLSGFARYQVSPEGSSAGVSVQRYSYESLFSDQSLSAEFAQSIQVSESREVVAGVRGRYRSLHFGGGYESISALLVDAGVRFDLLNALSIGVSAANLLGAKYEVTDRNEQFGQSFNAGLEYRPFPQELTVLAAIERAQDEAVRFRAGAEYVVEKLLAIRVGAVTNPSLITSGIGIHYSDFRLDAANVYHSELGNTLSFGIAWEW